MRVPRRRTALPDWVAGTLGRGERPLASAEAVDGTWLVGTRDALHVVTGSTSTPSTPPTTAVVPWEQVLRADWDQDTSTLRVERVADYGTPAPVRSFVLDQPGAVLVLLRERVTASIVLQRRVDLVGRRGFRVIARRAPSGSGEVSWAYEFDPGVDPADPGVLAAAERALAEARDALGL